MAQEELRGQDEVKPTPEEYDAVLDDYLVRREEELVDRWLDETYAEKRLRHVNAIGVAVAYVLSALIALILILGLYRILSWLWP